MSNHLINEYKNNLIAKIKEYPESPEMIGLYIKQLNAEHSTKIFLADFVSRLSEFKETPKWYWEKIFKVVENGE